jgi:hypothetical protein
LTLVPPPATLRETHSTGGNRIPTRRIVSSTNLLAIYLLIVSVPVLGPLAHAVDHLRASAAPLVHETQHAAEHHHHGPHHHHHDHGGREHAHAPILLAMLGGESSLDITAGEAGQVRWVVVKIQAHLKASALGGALLWRQSVAFILPLRRAGRTGPGRR